MLRPWCLVKAVLRELRKLYAAAQLPVSSSGSDAYEFCDLEQVFSPPCASVDSSRK